MKNYSVLSSVKNLPFMASLVSVKYFKSFKESYIFLLIIMLSDLSVWCWKTGAPVLRKCFFKLVFVSLCFYKIKHELIFKIWRKVFFEKLSLNCLHLGLLTSPSTQNHGSCMYVNLLKVKGRYSRFNFHVLVIANDCAFAMIFLYNIAS